MYHLSEFYWKSQPNPGREFDFSEQLRPNYPGAAIAPGSIRFHENSPFSGSHKPYDAIHKVPFSEPERGSGDTSAPPRGSLDEETNTVPRTGAVQPTGNLFLPAYHCRRPRIPPPADPSSRNFGIGPGRFFSRDRPHFSRSCDMELPFFNRVADVHLMFLAAPRLPRYL